MEFSKEKKPLQLKVFSQRYFFVIFFLIFIVSFSANTTYAVNNDESDRQADAAVAANPTIGNGGFDPYAGNQIMKQGVKARANAAAREESCYFLSTPGKCLLLPLFGFSSLLLRLSGILFTWIIDTDNIKLVLTSPALYEIWAYIRDLLNMAFILILLFSAFCTIFQIEKYNYKKLLWRIVLMALLVNFSFPITRFIIDASNILMYSLIKGSLFSTSPVSSSFGNIANDGSLKDLLNSSTWPDAKTLLAATIMIFMLAVTFLAIGVLLLVRIIALAILIIFSPVAFTGTIIPGLSSKASEWWDNLFKYSFFGPIMILGVIITTKLMNGVGADLSAKMKLAAAGQTPDNVTFLGSMAFIIVPIVLLWVMIGAAQKMSIAGAGAVMSKAQGAMKWAGAAPYRLTKKAAEATGIPGGAKQKWAQFKKAGILGSDARERREAKFAEKGPYSVKGAINEHARKKANEKRDEWKKTGAPPKEELQKLLDGSDDIKARAAALELAESTGFDGNYDNYKKALKAIDGDQSAIEALNEKTKKKGRDLVLAHKINTGKDKDGNPLKLQNELAKMDNADFGSIDFENLVKNTSSLGDRGGMDAVREFFKDAGPDRKIQISRRINKDNAAYLGDAIFVREERGTQVNNKPAPGTAPNARPGFV